ncbi:hypothetical protein [Conexibacter woesei]|uniref:Uncharacterized protein n=1 Tax=Conexibacter woesei (strain DSM 14684 / CCUG 47730 / CIP 108061 / JCM 11494 / NBRC 100937 / ID131577) TaxID=469383 RepID=D3F207_CONWI|nr:hypothetical protein [Conexibacter woesei]ADB50182.1 hypothetical protein Cwoe_1755 [Conexibacter woesei DSM 14684]
MSRDPTVAELLDRLAAARLTELVRENRELRARLAAAAPPRAAAPPGLPPAPAAGATPAPDAAPPAAAPPAVAPPAVAPPAVARARPRPHLRVVRGEAAR